jgi:hypothetical protein
MGAPGRDRDAQDGDQRSADGIGGPKMRARILGVGVGAAAVLLLSAGCATETGKGADSAAQPWDVTVRVEPANLAPATRGLSRAAKVEVSDIRWRVHSERTATGDVYMGRIVIEPDELEIVRALVQAKADAVLARLGRTAAPTIYCGVRAFHVETPATMLYWDVTTHVELVLRVGEQDRTASATKTKRTYLWPSQELVQGVTNEALLQLAAEAETVLTDLLAAR